MWTYFAGLVFSVVGDVGNTGVFHILVKEALIVGVGVVVVVVVVVNSFLFLRIIPFLDGIELKKKKNGIR